MKKSKLLAALLICTAVTLQANATDVSNWKGITDAFMSRNNGSDYKLVNDITVPKAEDIEGYSEFHDDNYAHFEDNSPLNLDLDGHTIFGEALSNGESHASFEIGKPQYEGGEQPYFPDADLKIFGGTIKNTIGAEYREGTILVENTQNLKELNIDFENNSSYAGGAIANVTEVNQPQNTYVSSVIGSVSGAFTNNKANYGGAIYNSGDNYVYEVIQDNGEIEYEPISDVSTIDLNTVLNITTNGKDTVFDGNRAEVAGGAIFNAGTINIDAKDSNKVVFETVSDDIYNVGVLNINSGETVVNSEISDKSVTVQGYNATADFGGTGITNIADGATLTLGDGAKITQQEINVSGALYAQNSGTLSGSLSIAETGTADLNADTLTSTVYNDGDLVLWGGTLNQNIQGEGITAILGEVTNNATITQGVFGIENEDGFSDGIFTTNINNLVIEEGKIHNYGTLKLTGGTNNYDITSTDTDNNAQSGGKTIIAGSVINNAVISQSDLEITDSANLTAGVNKLDIINAIKNDGILTLDGLLTNNDDEGYHLEEAISGNGKTVFNSGNTFVDNDVETEIEMIGSAAVSKKFGKAGKDILITSTGRMRAEAGSELLGNLKLDNGAQTQIVDVASLKNDVINNGELLLNNGILNKNITGNGNLNIADGIVENNAIIEQINLVVENEDSNGTTFITNADNLKLSGEILNSATLKFTGGENKNTINGNGSTVIDGDVINSAKISQAVNISSGTLTSNADDITAVSIDNGATYDVIGGSLTDSITGSGHLTLSDDFTSVAMAGFSGDVTVSEGKTLTVGDGVFDNASALNMSNGSILDLMDGAKKDVSINNLAIANGDVVDLKFDWGDTLDADASKVQGSLNVTDIDLSSTDGKASDYIFTNTLKDKIALDGSINFIATETSNNTVTYDVLTGAMASKRQTLAIAVDTVDETTGASLYTMTGDESADNETLTGNLTVQGNGNSITGGGIIIGDGKTSGSTLTLKDVNFDNISVSDGSQGAIHVNGGNNLEILAASQDITLENTKGATPNAIYLQKDDNYGVAKAVINAQGGEITITDNIMSDDKNNEVLFKGSKNIKFSGDFDPLLATVDMSGAELDRSGQDTAIDWNLNGGTLRYTKDSFLAGGTNSLNFNGGSLDLRNDAVNIIDLSALTLSKSSDLYLDVDLAAGKMDTFDTSVINVNDTSAKLHVAGLSLISDATSDETKINFVPAETGLTTYVDYTGSQGLKALSSVYKYNVAYDNTNGDFNFTRVAGGGYQSYNPSVLASPIAAQIGGYLTQLNSYDQAFRNMDMYMLMTRKQRTALKHRNKYASADTKAVYAPTNTIYEDKAMWFRPFATFENVPLKNGPRVSNVAYGSFIGGESELYDLGHGWDGMFGVYAGYNGSHQAYNGVSIYQNGGTLGASGMVYKGNFFTGLTLNAGANAGEASLSYGHDNFSMLMAGIASKSGYNWELADGKFIIQPSYLMSYSFINTFDYTNGNGARIDSDPLHAIQIEPGLKFIGNLKNGWQPYAGVSMVWNIMDQTHFKANNISLPELSVKPFVRYGVGVRKVWGDRFTGFIQTYITNGGRNGIGFQVGIRWALGKNNSTPIKSTNQNLPELKKTDIKLSSNK